ncbi:MAG: Spx/MgsR family RNA polymerase-binding regulatory protein [Proteobacteria bacterium]|nr:Spx/MgsR family RNA polymerase-binding regulatory protein [Pseudomonadota bacterium]
MVTVFGIKNCDTCRKALKWLETEGLSHEFHDFRKDGLTIEEVSNWLKNIDREILINKRGTTYRKLQPNEKKELDSESPEGLLLIQPTLFKRPIFKIGEQFIVGFKDAEKAALAGLLK